MLSLKFQPKNISTKVIGRYYSFFSSVNLLHLTCLQRNLVYNSFRLHRKAMEIAQCKSTVKTAKTKP
jgi:hypothetical protein